jgi:purine nucleosidase
MCASDWADSRGEVAAQRRLILIDQDGSGPGGTNQMSTMVLLQAQNVDVLGITIVTGDSWRDEEVLHTLRMLELIGHADVPVVPGAVFPLVRTEAETRLTFPLHGTPVWLGAWGNYSADVGLRSLRLECQIVQFLSSRRWSLWELS